MGTIGAYVLLLIAFCFEVTAAACPEGWSPHGSKCYLFVHETYSWFDAYTACKIMHGTLVEPRTNEENQFVGALFHSHGVHEWAWIGLYDIAEEGTFRWVSDMSRVQQPNWYPGQPSDQNGQEDCVSINQATATWNDDNCENHQLPFACEMENEGAPIG